MMNFRKKTMPQKQMNDLIVISRKLTPMSLAIFAVTNKAPTLEQLLRIAYERFRTIEVMRSVLKELNPAAVKAEPIFAGRPKTDKQKQMEKAQGKIIEVARPLSNYPPSKYKTLITKHLTVDKDGTVTLNDK